MIEERTERLINRRLDGELTPAESLELDKLLIRNPDARALLEEYVQMDGRAHDALSTCLSATDAPQDAAEIEPIKPPIRSRMYSLVAASGLAAAMAMAVLFSQSTRSVVTPSQSGVAALDHQIVQAPVDEESQLQWASAFEGPRRQTESLDREVLGVWDGESRRLYLLEADNASSLVEPVKYNY